MKLPYKSHHVSSLRRVLALGVAAMCITANGQVGPGAVMSNDRVLRTDAPQDLRVLMPKGLDRLDDKDPTLNPTPAKIRTLPRSPTVAAPQAPMVIPRTISIQQTVPGQEASNVVNVALKAFGQPVLSSLVEGLKEQVACDQSLEVGRKAFAQWKLASGDAALTAIDFDNFSAWHAMGNANYPGAAEVAETIEAFVGACFSANGPTGFPSTLLQRVGSLAGPDGNRRCTATQISGSSVATAKHCLRMSTPNLQDRDATSDEITAFTFHSPSTKIPFRVMGYANEPSPSRALPDDWAILTTEQLPVIGEAVPMPAKRSDVMSGARLTIAGLMVATDRKSEPFRPLFNRGQSCLVVYASRACLIHTCNSVAGMSGAPVFALIGESWVLAGIHHGAMAPEDFDEPACKGIATDSVRPSLASTNGAVYAPAVLP